MAALPMGRRRPVGLTPARAWDGHRDENDGDNVTVVSESPRGNTADYLTRRPDLIRAIIGLLAIGGGNDGKWPPGIKVTVYRIKMLL